MKTLNEYLALPYRMEIVEDREEGGYVVSYPDLPGCLTCGETIESAVENARDAKRVWLEAALEEGVSIPMPDSLEDYSGQFKLRLPRSLHRALAEHSQREGISMNQYCVYLLAKMMPCTQGKRKAFRPFALMSGGLFLFSPSFFAFFARKIAGTYSLTTQPKGVTLWVIKQRCVMQKKEVFP